MSPLRQSLKGDIHSTSLISCTSRCPHIPTPPSASSVNSPPQATQECYLKDNVQPLVPPRSVDPKNNTMSGLRQGTTCNPKASPVDMCPEGYPCPQCGASTCSCEGPNPGHVENPFACIAPHNTFPFCDTTLSVEDRVWDLVNRINDSDKANLLTARGKGGGGSSMQALPALGVPT
jgi:hypothetical protein